MLPHEINSFCTWLGKFTYAEQQIISSKIHRLTASHPELLDTFPCDWDRFYNMIGE